ncbi:MAG: TonB-dependent receptor plug domain-containing protein [Opitutaceae bacterium]
MFSTHSRRLITRFLCAPLITVALAASVVAQTATFEFAIPPQSAAKALLAFSKVAQASVLFPYDELENVKSSGVIGRHEPDAAIALLLGDTDYIPQHSSPNRYVIVKAQSVTGVITGRLITAAGKPAANISLDLLGTRLSETTDRGGGFRFTGVAPGTYTLLAQGEALRPIQWPNLNVRPGATLELPVETMQEASDLTLLEPLIISASAVPQSVAERTRIMPLTATGNLDLPRSEDDALPFRIYERTRIARSGVVNLNDYLRRELLDSDASTLPPEQDGARESFLAGSSNLNLRGLGADATIILVNGRRLPESSGTTTGYLGAPDVNFIPLNLVDHIEVLPTSASALYNGNPVGGVINIVLRPDIDHTEINATYTNSLDDYDAPNTSLSLQHGQSLFDGRLKVRLSASLASAMPPTEAELGYLRGLAAPAGTIFRATPNIRSADGGPLASPEPLAVRDNPAIASVAPGADGMGGLNAFSGRIGRYNFDLFDPAGGLAVSEDSVDYPYGRRQSRQSWFLSTTYDALPWLQLGLDTIYTRTTVNRGFDVFRGDLMLSAASQLNPFGRDIVASLNETASAFGEEYSEARLELISILGGALITLPANWRISLDAQYARNFARYRGFAGVDEDHWQLLVDRGEYNPLRDTQVHAAPTAFYDEVLVHFGSAGNFTKLGDYTAIDTAVRATNRSLSLPTGDGAAAIGFDYRFTQLADYTQHLTYADGREALPPVLWDGRTLERVSVFGELQGPLVPARLLPRWIASLEGVLAARYTAADTSRETNLAPTFGLKIGFGGGLAFRGSATLSNRYPTSAMSRRIELTSGGGGPGVNFTSIYDPLRDQTYAVRTEEDLNPDVLPEGAVTQSAGFIFQRGEVHHIRASLDFVDTRKENEILFLAPQAIFNLESLWPERITRAPAEPNAPGGAGAAQSVLTGLINVASRHSQNWNAALDYTWTECLGGELDLGLRASWVQTYNQRTLPEQPTINQLNRPDGSVSGLLPFRASWNTAWTNRNYGFGVEGHYYHSRKIPLVERPAQGGSSIAAYAQLDIFAQCDLTRIWPRLARLHQVNAQVRVNNVLGEPFPRYANDPSGAAVQAYGDWRGRTYSLSVTVAF